MPLRKFLYYSVFPAIRYVSFLRAEWKRRAALKAKGICVDCEKAPAPPREERCPGCAEEWQMRCAW